MEIKTNNGISNDGTQLPDNVTLLLTGKIPDASSPDMFAFANIRASGCFGQAWVVQYGNLLFVVDLNEYPSGRIRDIQLEKNVELEIVPGAGSSRFRILLDGKLEEELRFTPSEAKRFSMLLHSAQSRIKGETGIPVSGEPKTSEDRKICRKCHRLIPEWADTCPRCLHKRRILFRLLYLSATYRKLLTVGIIGALGTAALQLIPPKLTQRLINDVLTKSSHQRTDLLWPLIGLLAAVILVRGFFSYLRLNCLANLAENVTHDLRQKTFAHLQKLSLDYFSRKPTGNLISRITNDTDRLWDFIAFGFIDVAISAVMLLGIAVIMFREDVKLATLTLTPIPLSCLLTWLHVKTLHPMMSRLWNKWSDMCNVLSDVIPGVRVVKAFTQEEREIGRFTSRSQAVVDDAKKMHREWTTYWPRLTLLLNLGTLIIWIYAAPRILDETFQLGTFVMFIGYVWMFYGPIENLGMMNRMFQRAITSAHRVFSVLDTSPAVYSKPSAASMREIQGKIMFDNVSFSYDGVTRVLQNISFTVNPGEIIGLAGPSGGGKTTMINLICRFYDPVEGRILIDDVDLRDWDLHTLRSRIGVVLQEPYLFRGTVAENITYGNPHATTEQIIAAARAANAHDFIVGFPDGYDAMIGERGQTVSGGERQRLSLARAILTDPRILILDEATSSVDSKTEWKIQEAIDRLVHGRTTIAIAHRLSTLSRATRLLILDKGKLIEQGTHEELIAAGGLYSKLYKTQAELHALFAV